MNKIVGGKGYTKLILQSNTMSKIVGGKGYNKWLLQSKPMNKLVGGSRLKNENDITEQHYEQGTPHRKR